MPPLNLGITTWIFPVIGIALLFVIIWQVRKARLTTTPGNETTDSLIDIVDKQKDNLITYLVVTDRIWFEFKCDAKRPYIWVRIYYKNLGIHDLMISSPEGYVYYASEQLPDRIIAKEGQHNVSANGGICIFDLTIYIPPEFNKDISAEVDSPTGEVRKLQLHDMSANVYIKGDNTHSVKWSLGGERVIFRPNR